MCSIIGYCGVFDSQVVERVFTHSRIRGLHAFGFSYYENNLITTKKFLSYDEFVTAVMEVKPELFIAHFRYSTSGDFKNIDNNQPLQLQDKAIAFNGVISQKDKEAMELEYGLSLPTENDGYILIQKYYDKEFIKNKNISFAFVGLENKKLIAMRNSMRPMHLFKNNNIKLLCSTKDILERSGLNGSIEVEPFKLLEF